METVRKFTYLGDRVSAGGGCDATVTARAKCGCAESLEYGELLHGNRCSLKQNGAVNNSYAKPAILYGSET